MFDVKMDKKTHIFHGDVNVYLQGRNALFSLGYDADTMVYFIFSPQSAILIRDHRRAPNDAANQVLNGNHEFEFADVFNQPAWVELEETSNGIIIDLSESDSRSSKNLILWVGVLEDEMPVRIVEWEYLIPVEENQIAFAALVR